ncbi:MAG: hypothetical protein AAB037_06465, partial [Chloroflexota bacterium]
TAAVAIYTYDGTAWSSASVFNQRMTFLAQDLAQITGEILHTSLYAPMVADNLPPETKLNVQGSSAVLEGRLFIPFVSRITLSADDRTPKGGVNSGVNSIFVSLDGAPEKPYTGPVFLTGGRHELSYFSRDRLGNEEPVRSTIVYKDMNFPRALVSVDQSSFLAEGGFGIDAATATLTILVEDAGMSEARSGLGWARYVLDGSTAPLDFVPGISSASVQIQLGTGVYHLILAVADRVGNTFEKSLRVEVGDTLPPVTGLALGEPRGLLNGATVVHPLTPLVLSAQDFRVYGPASGVKQTNFRIFDSMGEPGPYGVYAGSFSLLGGDGSKTVEYFSEDNAGNSEIPSRQALVLDGTSPGIVISSPAADRIWMAGGEKIGVDSSVLDAFDPAPSSAAYLTQVEDRGSPRGGRPELVPVITGQELDPLQLDDGLWRLRVSATDFIQNAGSAMSGTFEVLHDIQPPRTTFGIGAPSLAEGFVLPLGTIVSAFLGGATPFNLSSVDDLTAMGDASGLGVSFQLLEVDGVLRSSFTNANPAAGGMFSSSFTLVADLDGLHFLGYYARDTLGNLELPRISTVAVDNTAPATVLALSASASDPYLSSSTALSLSAEDPSVNGVASGLEETLYRINGGTFAASTSSFILQGEDGIFTLDYLSRDRLGNAEGPRSRTLILDKTPPASALSASGGRQARGPSLGSFFASSDTRLSIIAQDPLVSGVASGVGLVFLKDNGISVQHATAAFSLIEGVHLLEYQSRDRVGNEEILLSTTALVDASPPVTEMEVAGASTTFGGNIVVGADGSVNLRAHDPAGAGVASGFSRTHWSLDGAAGVSDSSMTVVSLGAGGHFLEFRSEDRVGNLESQKTLEIAMDTAPPRLGGLAPAQQELIQRGIVLAHGLAGVVLERFGDKFAFRAVISVDIAFLLLANGQA